MSKTREPEFQQTALGDGWLELRIVFRTTGAHGSLNHRADEARLSIMRFAVSYTMGVVQSFGQSDLAAALKGFWKHINGTCNCVNRTTQH